MKKKGQAFRVTQTGYKRKPAMTPLHLASLHFTPAVLRQQRSRRFMV
jgi:hypothetical protein